MKILNKKEILGKYYKGEIFIRLFGKRFKYTYSSPLSLINSLSEIELANDFKNSL